MADLIHKKRGLTSFQIIILGFAGVILVGALLLMLPMLKTLWCSRIRTKPSLAEGCSMRCKSTSKVVSAPISKARWTSMPDTSSAVNAVRNCICTDASPLLPKRTSSNAVDTKPKAVLIARRIIFVSKCWMKSCLAEYRR